MVQSMVEDPSLRLKTGCAQDDAIFQTELPTIPCRDKNIPPVANLFGRVSMTTSVENPKAKSIARRGIRQLIFSVGLFAVLILIPAWSWRYWQGWLYLGLMAGFWTYFFLDLLKNDPELVERRMKTKESATQQKLLHALLRLVMVAAYVLAGLDFHFGWTRSWFGGVPLWLELAGQALVVASYWWVFWVMKTNSFAASTIQVEAQQRVIDVGPYAYVRHPMYAAMCLANIGTPLALGSYVVLPVFALYIPVLIFRLIHEERFLRQSLPGYAEYCDRTPFRLAPFVW